MSEVRTLLADLALILCVAALTAVLFRKLRQPVVLGQLLAGMIVGPHIPVPLFADVERMHELSELGVILVMFSVGLEFSIRRLIRVLPSAGGVGLIQLSTMLALGYAAAQALGWSTLTSVFVGAMLAISSTMVVAKVFAEQKVEARLSEVVFGVLVVQDLAAVLLLALLTAFTSGTGAAGAALFTTARGLAGFLVVMVVLGFVLVPRTIRAVARLGSSETLLIASVGLCFLAALIAHEVGYSVALGAFLAGSLVAESGHAEEVEHLVAPLRDVFAAIFFVSVGSLLDPRVLFEQWPAVLLLSAVVLVGQICSVTLGVFLSGQSVRTSIRAGMSLAQIGEFSFIIVGIGVASGKVPDFLYSVAVAVAVLTALVSPWLIRVSEPVAIFIDHRLPGPMHAFIEVYGSWVQGLGAERTSENSRRKLRRSIWLIAVDMILLGLIIVGTSLLSPTLAVWVEAHTGLTLEYARIGCLAVGGLLAVPFLFGIARVAGALSRELVTMVLPPEGAEGRHAMRPALVITSQLIILLFVGVPLVAVTQPFIPSLYGAAVLAVLLAMAGVAFWRSMVRLEDEVHAGAELVIAALAKQSLPTANVQALDVGTLLPGFGPLHPFRLEAGAQAVGRTLAEINLRALSGATVIAIVRGEDAMKPTGREALEVGDVLALAGPDETLKAAEEVLSQGRIAVS